MTSRLARLAARSRRAVSEAAVADRFWAELRALPNDPDLVRQLADHMKENRCEQ